MRVWFYECNDYEQSIKGNASWSCTCKHGSIGRFKKDCNFPCVHALVAYKKWATEVLIERKKIQGGIQ
jgi:hypothetical protein